MPDCSFFILLQEHAQTESLNQNIKFMLRHTVVFKLKASPDPTEELNFFNAAQKLATIPGVQKFESLRQTSKKNNYDFGLSMEFANAGIYEQYTKHPLHVEFVQKYWVPLVAEFMEIDYEPLMK